MSELKKVLIIGSGPIVIDHAMSVGLVDELAGAKGE